MKFKQWIQTAPLLICTILVGFCYWGYQGVQALAPKEKPKPPAPPTVATEPSVKPTETTAPIKPSKHKPSALTVPTVPTETPAPTEPLPKTFTTVDDDYFKDALFFGNSRIRLLGEYTPFDGAVYYGVDCLTVYDAMDDDTGAGGFANPYEALAARTYGKIYIAFGINECGYGTDSFIEHYQQIIDTVRAYQPTALIYVQDIMYVTESKVQDSGMFATSVLSEKNERIAQLADGETIFYLHTNEAVDNGYGYMRSELSGDGVHLYANEYHLWSDYLKTHAIVDQDHPANP